MRSKNIAIQKSDKGNTVVIIDKEKYNQGVENVIPKSSKFISSPSEDYTNYIINVEKKLRKLFNNLYDNNKISKDKLLKLCPVGSSSLFMASLDVQSLFTNIPVKETINNCVSDLHNDRDTQQI